MNKGRVRRAARQDAEQVAKLVAVQEKQIAALKAEVVALEAVLVGVAGLTFDYVDWKTGEVEQRPLVARVASSE